MKASKWLARWNYVFYITRSNWKNLGELAYIFANMQMFLYATSHMRTGSSSSLWANWYFVTKASMIPDWQLKVDCFPTSPAKTNIMCNYINRLEDTPTFPYSFWQQAETYNAMLLASSMTYTAHPTAYCTSISEGFIFSADIWEALSVSSMWRVE